MNMSKSKKTRINRLHNTYNENKVKFREKCNCIFAPIRRSRLKDIEFSIISNNCWAGHVYRYYGIQYNTPTIGLYIWAKDYMVLLHNLKAFFSSDLMFISADESEYRAEFRTPADV